MPSGSSYRPGDIIKSSGKSIEVINTDAEGRLILADALYYATTNADSVSCVIDVATLTGAIDVALGYYGCGMFTNNRAFFEESLAIAQDRTGELVHPYVDFPSFPQFVRKKFFYFKKISMPIAKWHKKQIESSVADIRNSTDSRSGGACTAAAFLQHFVAEVRRGKTLPSFFKEKYLLDNRTSLGCISIWLQSCTAPRQMATMSAA